MGDAAGHTRRLRRSTRSKKPIVIEVDTDEGVEVEDAPQTRSNKRQKVSHLTSKFRNFDTRKTNPIAVSSLSRQPSRIEPLERTPETPTDKTLPPDGNLQWIDKYLPHTTADVAIHSRKLREVREVLSEMLHPRITSQYKILLLTGAAGTSKSTVIKCLAEELANPRSAERPYIEWINPIEGGTALFSDFLNSVKMRVGTSKTVILVEDIPNVFHEETRVQFQQALLEWSYSDYELPPVVICLTECDMNTEDNSRGFSIENNYLAETVLGRRLLSSPGVRRIKFNPINYTLSKKHLMSIVSNEPAIFKAIPKSETNAKVEKLANFGDIRSSIFALQFWAKWRSHNNNSDVIFPDIGKESVISLFHAAGKCIFGTKDGKKDDNDAVSQAVKDFATRSQILRLALLENYPSFGKGEFDLKRALSISDNLSIADTMKSDVMSLEIATRGVRTAFSSLRDMPHHTGITFPREWKVNKASVSVKRDIGKYIELELKKNTSLRTFGDSNLYYGFFEPLINIQRAFKNKAKIAYLKSQNKTITTELYSPRWPYIQERLGGPFSEIYGDENMAGDDEFYITASNNAAYFNDKLLTSTADDTDSGSEFVDDPIVDDDDYDDLLNDTFDRELLAVSQRPSDRPQQQSHPTSTPPVTRQPSNVDFLNDFDEEHDFDDSDL